MACNNASILSGKVFINTEDPVAIESPGYLGAILIRNL
jgi:DNA-binding transcriptional MocR family regulator